MLDSMHETYSDADVINTHLLIDAPRRLWRRLANELDLDLERLTGLELVVRVEAVLINARRYCNTQVRTA